jgi:N-dimethylarginine dimethylaminohydrolase
MVAPLQRVLVCSPRSAGWDIATQAERWQGLGFLHSPEFSTAQSQHDQLCRQLETAGAEIIHLPAASELSLDAVYTHDPSLTTDQGLIGLNPGKANRVPEAKHHVEFSRSLGIPTAGQIHPPGKTESGDMVWLDDKTLLIGRGFRTNSEGIAQMRELLPGVKVVSAPLPYGVGPSACLHLMSLMSLLDEKAILVDLPWLAVETVQEVVNKRKADPKLSPRKILQEAYREASSRIHHKSTFESPDLMGVAVSIGALAAPTFFQST